MWPKGLARKAVLIAATVAVVGTGVAGTALSAGATDPTTSVRTRHCTPGYKPCIPDRPSDVDCYGGGGNGPRYTKPGVVYKVWGADRYGLDGDNDGRGCE
jgi:hypothetical protein